ncbi:hypothetical protein [Mesorhizobium sp.]|uniref:hypothetical protein n=1 Tax=Mesorhizobium sp. TaxID=1871066 RepID=UPI000FE6FD03|nr:hypothetical protein [Mesorhizobium sp.]RWH31618.1 MAG: hypothetical protein EOQ76_07325 [Mesorhizobium sp.]TIR57671.1 MAG: hypothetical protein E5X22_22875 [Mesorhizobium sp.]
MPARPETLQEHRRRRAYAAAIEAVEPVETAFDRAVNWLAEHPRLTCLVICAGVLLAFALETPR